MRARAQAAARLAVPSLPGLGRRSPPIVRAAVAPVQLVLRTVSADEALEPPTQVKRTLPSLPPGGECFLAPPV